MSLYEKRVVRRFRRAVRKRLKELKAKPGGVFRRKFTVDGPWLRVPLFLVALGSAEAMLAEHGAEWLLIALTVFGTAEAVRRGRNLQFQLTDSWERILFQFYPASPEFFYRLTIKRFLIASLWVWSIAAVTYGVASGGEGRWVLRALGFATLQWVVTTAFAVTLTRKAQWLPRRLPLALYFLGFALLYCPLRYRKPLFVVSSVLPSGWASAIFRWAGNGLWSWTMLVAATVGAGALAYWLLQEYGARTSAWERSLVVEYQRPTKNLQKLDSAEKTAEAGGKEIEAEHGEDHGSGDDERVRAAWQKIGRQRYAEDVAAYIESGEWLQPLDWAGAKWMERTAIGFLTIRERIYLQYMLGCELPKWTERWRMAVIAAAGGAVFATIGGEAGTTLAVISLIFSSMLATGGRGWPIMNSGWLGTKLCPIHACLPFDFTAASRVMSKVTLARMLAWIPMGLIVGALLGWQNSGSAASGVWMTAKAILGWAACLPLIGVAHFSFGTNDTKELRLRTAPLVVFGIVIGICGVIAAFTAIFRSGMLSFALLVAVFAVNVGLWAGYRRGYQQWQIDLLKTKE